MRFTKNMAVLFLGAGLAIGTFAVPFLSQSASAQTITTGDIVGRVTDSTGAALAGATVKLTSLDTDAVQSIVAGSDGGYRFALLRPGAYAIAVESRGLSVKVKSVAVNVGQAITVNLQATPQGATSTVEVDATAPMLQTQDANISTTFDASQIDALPIPGGDIAAIPNTAPGVNFSLGGGYGGFTAFGLPGTSNLYTLNGSDDVDAYLNLNNSGASNLSLGINEIAEVAVVNNGYTGQYGRFAGTQINYTTMAGGNKFHGNANYYYNGTAMNSNSWFTNHNGQARPHSVNNAWATRVGGPIWRDKLFFLADYEGLRYVLPGGGNIQYLPSPAFLAATLANVTALHPEEAGYYKQIADLYNNSGAAKVATPVVTDPATQPNGSCSDVAGVANGLCSLQFVNSANSLNTERVYSVRIDWNLSQKDKLFGRYRNDAGVQATSTDPINPIFSANSVQPEWEMQINETHLFSPSVVNSFVGAGMYYSAIFGPPNIKGSLAVFPTTLVFATDYSYANLGGTNYNYPQGRNVTQWQLVDDLSVTRGIHAFKVGFNYRRDDVSDYRSGVETSGETDINALSDFYNGDLSPDNGSLVFQRFSPFHQVPIAFWQLGVYAQDQIAISPQFNVTLALRADRNSNPVCHKNCFSRFRSPFGELSHDITTPYNTSINSSNNQAFSGIDAVVIQPRVGFAYTPSGPDGKTVIRGGVGLFSDLPPGTVVDRFLTNAPNISSFSISSTSGTNNLTVLPGSASSAYGIAAQSAAAFISGFANGATFADLKAATGGLFSAPNFNDVNKTFKTPRYLEWSLEVQRALSHNDVIDVAYVGNYGSNLVELFGQRNAASASGFGGLPTTKPDRRFKAVTSLTNLGHSNYNGGTVSYRHQFTYGFQGAVNYTYSHSLDTVSNGGLLDFVYNGSSGLGNPQGVIDPYAISRLNYGSSDYDVRHSFSSNYIWNIPIKLQNGLLNAVVAGWTISGTAFWRDGYPYSVINSIGSSKKTKSTSTGTVFGEQIAPGLGKCVNGNSTCLLPTQFSALADQTTFGNRSRNSYNNAPRYFDTDLTLAKTTKIWESASFKVGANAFNVTNHPNFAQPDNNLADGGTFGTIQGTLVPYSSPYGSFQGANGSARILQVFGNIQF